MSILKQNKKGLSWRKTQKHRGVRRFERNVRNGIPRRADAGYRHPLKRSGVSSLIEAGAGIAADYTDEDYEKAGAKVTSRDEVLAEADALGFVDRPSAETVAKLKAGQWVIGMLGSFTDADYVAALEKAGLVGIAIEKLPRKLSSAQSMDEMTSQNSVMGYKAAITAADAYGSFLPMMTTAAGTIRPAKALVLGAGIAACRPSVR